MDDKKKTIVVAALFVAMLAIGAFQFTRGGGEEPAKPTDAKATADGKDGAVKDPKFAKKDDKDKAMQKVLLPALSERDPFHPVSLPPPDPNQPGMVKPQVKVAPPTPVSPRPALPKVPPMQLDPTGNFAPLPAGSTPNGEIGQLRPAPPVFGYHLRGIITGARPVAVFTDAQGNERLVPQGGSLDGNAQVVSVSRDGVIVRSHGKTLRLTPGGNDSEN